MKLFTPRRAPPAAPASPPTVEAIFRDELRFIVGALLHFGIAPIDVEDAAHEVIRALLRSLPTFDPSRELRPWLYGVSFNVASNHFRRAERHRARFVDEPADMAVPDLTTTIEEQMILEETYRTVREALREITLDRRAVLVARVIHGWSELETAEALSIPIGTVKTRLRLAKQDLRDGIQRREREENRAQRGAFLLPLGALLAREGQIPDVPADMRARLWEQLQRMKAQQSAPTSAPAPANDGGPAPGVSQGVPLAARLRGLAESEAGRAFAAAAFGGALVFALGPIPRAPAAPVAPTITREDLAALCAVPVAAGASASAPGSAAPTTAPSAPRAARTSAPALPSAAAEIADPPDSADLLASATVALERHDIATARRLLEQQAHDFPRSRLGVSRDLLWVRVLLSEGKRAEAQAKAEAIRKAVPNSPMIKSLDALFPSAEPLP